MESMYYGMSIEGDIWRSFLILRVISEYSYFCHKGTVGPLIGPLYHSYRKNEIF